jgi:hypothetical protein
MQQLAHNSLLANVNLDFTTMCNSTAMLTFLTQIRPLITGINSIDLTRLKDAIDLFQNEYAEVAMPMLASARVLCGRSVEVLQMGFKKWFFPDCRGRGGGYNYI